MHVCSLSECVWAVRDLLTEICEFCLEVVRTFDTTAVFVVGLLSQKKKQNNQVYVFFLIILTFRIVAVFMLL